MNPGAADDSGPSAIGSFGFLRFYNPKKLKKNLKKHRKHVSWKLKSLFMETSLKKSLGKHRKPLKTPKTLKHIT